MAYKAWRLMGLAAVLMPLLELPAAAVLTVMVAEPSESDTRTGPGPEGIAQQVVVREAVAITAHSVTQRYRGGAAADTSIGPPYGSLQQGQGAYTSRHTLFLEFVETQPFDFVVSIGARGALTFRDDSDFAFGRGLGGATVAISNVGIVDPANQRILVSLPGEVASTTLSFGPDSPSSLDVPFDLGKALPGGVGNPGTYYLAISYTLSFQCTSRNDGAVQSPVDLADDGPECAVRLGEVVPLSGQTVSQYPGAGDRDKAQDGVWLTVSMMPLACGNGVIEDQEQCDEGEANGTPGSCCTLTCRLRPAGEVCRAGGFPFYGSQCDPSEVCSGDSPDCPADVMMPAGTPCAGIEGDVCFPPVVCTGVSGEGCPVDSTTGGQVCRPAAGACDVAETCVRGTFLRPAYCPADALRPAGYMCRGDPIVDPCDPDEFCSGGSADCPNDIVRLAGFVCRAGSGDACDPDEVCSGQPRDLCPPDQVRPAGFECRAAAGVCDVGETCSGVAGQACPADAKQPGTFVCRAAGDPECDVAEHCDGTGDVCPADAFRPAGTACTDTELANCFDPYCDGSGHCDQAAGGVAVCAPDGKAQCEVTLGDFVWNDVDFDGNQDAEAGIAGVKVNLIDCEAPAIVADQLTGVSGDYRFTVPAVDASCEPGPRNLSVEADASNFVALLAGFSASPPDAAPDDVDSDANPIGFGTLCTSYPAGTNDATVDLGFTERIQVGLDVKPGSCPNSVNVKDQGVVPVALIGSADFDPSQVDVATLRLCLPGQNPLDPDAACVAPKQKKEGPQTSLEDAATAFDGDACGCHERTGDGTLDLTAKFDAVELVAALGLEGQPRDALVPVALRGNLLPQFGGTPFEGRDCVRVVTQKR